MTKKQEDKDNSWLYFNMHNLVGIRVQAGHASQPSVHLTFGPFESETLEHIDLTLQYDLPEMGAHSFASKSYLFTNDHVYIKKYKLHFIREEDSFILASKRDILPFLNPVL